MSEKDGSLNSTVTSLPDACLEAREGEGPGVTDPQIFLAEGRSGPSLDSRFLEYKNTEEKCLI